MTDPTEVVSVIRHDVRPEHQAAYEAWTREVVPIAQQFDGHHGVAVIRPPDGGLTYTVVLHFDTLDHLKAWLESDIRRNLLTRVQPHLSHPGQVEIRPGLDFWLSAPGLKRAAPHRQFLIALSVIFPLSLLVPMALSPLLEHLPGGHLAVVRALIASATIVGLMTYAIMPRYTRLVGHWLYADPRPYKTNAALLP
jgi:antibiotic biosynthesis monooxygenase (ABM) superfamily enzyme